MKNNEISHFASRLLLAIVLLMGVSEPLHAVSMSGQQVTDQPQVKQQKKAKKKKIKQLKSNYRDFIKKLDRFNDCLKGRDCTKGEQNAASAAAILLLLAVMGASVYGALVGLDKYATYKAKKGGFF